MDIGDSPFTAEFFRVVVRHLNLKFDESKAAADTLTGTYPPITIVNNIAFRIKC